MGYRLVFKKIKKHKVRAMLQPVFEFYDRSDLAPVEAIEFMEEGYDFDHWYKTLREIEEIKKKSAFMIDAITFTEDMSQAPEE